jgi:hypothetical protein
MATLPPILTSGPRGVYLSAGWLNQLRDFVASLANVGVGDGLSIVNSSTGIMISSTASAAEWRRGVIKAAPIGADALASAIRYDVKVVGIDVLATNLEAKISRPAQGSVRLVPARVGDPCFVLLVPDGDGTFTAWLWAMTETLAFAPCGTGSPTAIVTIPPGNVQPALNTIDQGTTLPRGAP